MGAEKSAHASNQYAFLFRHRILFATLLVLLSRVEPGLASYHRDPWLGTAEKSPLQALLWTWGVPWSWLEHRFPSSRMFLTNIYSLNLSHLTTLKSGLEGQNAAETKLLESQPRSLEHEEIWHGHVSLLSARWGDNQNLSPISPFVQTVWLAPEAPPPLSSLRIPRAPPEVWKKNIQRLLVQEAGLTPVVVHHFWNFDEGSLHQYVFHDDRLIWPLNTSALSNPEDENLCKSAILALIAESVSLQELNTIPECAPDFSSSSGQTTGLSPDGKTPLYLQDQWVLQTMLAGSLGHLIAIRPGLMPLDYIHLLRSTVKDYSNRNWAFGTPQVHRAVASLLHRNIPQAVPFAPRVFSDVTILLGSFSSAVEHAELVEPAILAKKTQCKGTSMGALRCLIRSSSPPGKSQRLYKVKVVTLRDGQRSTQEIQFQ